MSTFAQEKYLSYSCPMEPKYFWNPISIHISTPIISGHKKSLLKYKKWQKSMAHFVMQKLAELENQTYKETCVFPQFKQEKHSSNRFRWWELLF